MKKKRSLQTALTFFLACAMFSHAIQASALTSVTASYAGISDYLNCEYGDRAGKQYVQNFSAELQDLEDNGRLYYSELNMLTDSAVTPSSISNISPATFFVFAGHGFCYSDSPYNGLHVSHTSSSCTDSTILKNIDTNFEHKYVVLYSCNQLTNKGDATRYNNIMNMMDGTRLIFGFASSMWLDSRDATTFVYRMGWFSDMIEAYMFSAEYYQVQHPTVDVVARVVGYTEAYDDNLREYESYAPSAISSPDSFEVLETVTIPHLGYLP